MPTKRTTKRTTQIAAARPMTGAEAFEAGRRAYEAAADWSTGAAVPTAEPQPCASHDANAVHEAGPMADDRMTRPGHNLGRILSRSARRGSYRSRSRLDQPRANVG
jgi:hypothetical protein